VPVTVAGARADGRAEADSARAKDLYETDAGLQARCAAVYDGLAAAGWLAPWSVIDGAGGPGLALSEVALQMLGR
jgi:dTMP kinase